MIHKVKIDYMPDGYSVATGGTCFDLPAAVIAANYSRECYKYYLALQVFKSNWCETLQEWEDAARESFAALHFQMDSKKTCSWSEFLSVVKSCIDQDTPVLVPVSYHKLFYYLEFNGKSPHMLMVTGYDDERELIFIIDCNIVEHGLQLPNKEYTLYQLPLSYKIFEEIWSDSHLYLFKANSRFCYKIYIVKPDRSQSAFCQNDFVIALRAIFPTESQNRYTLIRKYVADLMNSHDSETFKNFFISTRREAYLQHTVLFDALEDLIDAQLKVKWGKLRAEYMKCRGMMLNRVYMGFIDSGQIDEKIIRDKMPQIIKLEDLLMDCIKVDILRDV